MYERHAVRDLGDYAVRITAALYRVTERLPQLEPLRMHIREKADEILAVCSEFEGKVTPEQILSKISTITGYLVVAQTFRQPEPINFTVLLREYEELATAFRIEASKSILRAKTERSHISIMEPRNEARVLAKAAVPSMSRVVRPPYSTTVRGEMSDRQRAILTRVQEAGKAKVSDFYEAFNGVSAKTVQRDLQDLVARNILRKEGEKRWTIYFLNNV